MCSFVAVGPLFGGGFGGGGYTFTVPGLPPAAHAMTKTNFLFDHSKYSHKFKKVVLVIVDSISVDLLVVKPQSVLRFLFSIKDQIANNKDGQRDRKMTNK